MHGVHSFTGQIKSVLQLSPHATTRIFFLGRIPTLARARQGADAGQVARPGGFYAGQVARQECGRSHVGRLAPMPGRNVMLESISGTYAFEVPRNWKQAPTIFWLVPVWSSAADCAARRHTTREINESASVSQLR